MLCVMEAFSKASPSRACMLKGCWRGLGEVKFPAMPESIKAKLVVKPDGQWSLFVMDVGLDKINTDKCSPAFLCCSLSGAVSLAWSMCIL